MRIGNLAGVVVSDVRRLDCMSIVNAENQLGDQLMEIREAYRISHLSRALRKSDPFKTSYTNSGCITRIRDPRLSSLPSLVLLACSTYIDRYWRAGLFGIITMSGRG